jgi:hypothetical protein
MSKRGCLRSTPLRWCGYLQCGRPSNRLRRVRLQKRRLPRNLYRRWRLCNRLPLLPWRRYRCLHRQESRW